AAATAAAGGRPRPPVAPAGEARRTARGRGRAPRLAPDRDLAGGLALHRGARLAREGLAEAGLVGERPVGPPLPGSVRVAGRHARGDVGRGALRPQPRPALVEPLPAGIV